MAFYKIYSINLLQINKLHTIIFKVLPLSCALTLPLSGAQIAYRAPLLHFTLILKSLLNDQFLLVSLWECLTSAANSAFLQWALDYEIT